MPSFADRASARKSWREAVQLDLSGFATHFIDRVSARRLLGLRSDPDEFPAGSPQAFIAGLAEQIRATTSFSLVSQEIASYFEQEEAALESM